MDFSADNCEVLHLGSQTRARPSLGMKRLWRVVQQRDLRMQVNSFLKVASQVDRVVKKAFGKT